MVKLLEKYWLFRQLLLSTEVRLKEGLVFLLNKDNIAKSSQWQPATAGI